MQRKKPPVILPLQQGPRGCTVCTLQPACLPWELEPSDIQRLERIVDRSVTVPAGKHLFRFGEPLRSVYVVRSGAFKNYRMDAGGRERVLGFILPGELVGVDGIYPRRHESNAVALKDSAICELPYAALTSLMGQSEGLRRQILRLVSKDGVYALSFSLDSTADQRIAAFLLNLSHRAQVNGRSATELDLAMSQQDIASYLRLSIESVARILARFKSEGMLALDGQHLTLLDAGQIGDIATRH